MKNSGCGLGWQPFLHTRSPNARRVNRMVNITDRFGQAVDTFEIPGCAEHAGRVLARLPLVVACQIAEESKQLACGWK
jgi:hypothetical protein